MKIKLYQHGQMSDFNDVTWNIVKVEINGKMSQYEINIPNSGNMLELHYTNIGATDYYNTMQECVDAIKRHKAACKRVMSDIAKRMNI